MRVDVYALPGAALAVQSFQKRGEKEYLDAHEELRAEVHKAIAHSGKAPTQPYRRAELTIGCYTGKRTQGDGRYRAERVNTLHYVLDPIYRALLDARVIADMKALYEIRTYLERDSDREGFRIHVTEISAE